MLYGPNEKVLLEKRQALTSLKTYKPGLVGSIRQISSSGPGMLGSSRSVQLNGDIPVYLDNGEHFLGAQAYPASILTAAKQNEAPKENILKPGPWTTMPVKKRQAAQKSTPSFTGIQYLTGMPHISRQNIPPVFWFWKVIYNGNRRGDMSIILGRF